MGKKTICELTLLKFYLEMNKLRRIFGFVYKLWIKKKNNFQHIELEHHTDHNVY